MEPSLNNQSSYSEINSNHPKPHRIVIGYYNLRGKAQVCRLLCQYIGVQYEDKLFNLAQWQRFSLQKAKDWPFVCLPFLRQGSFVVTESVPMCIYVINRFGNQQLLGKNLRDRAIVQMYIWTIEYMGNVITINCQQKSAEELQKFKLNQWNTHVYPRLMKLEEAASDGRWFLDYLTIIDFSMYELIRYMDNIFDGQTACLKKLKRIEKEVLQLEAIKNYEQSSRAIVEWCPTKLLQSFKQATLAQSNSQQKSDSVSCSKGDKKSSK